jgi:uncharacterized protein YuzE
MTSPAAAVKRSMASPSEKVSQHELLLWRRIVDVLCILFSHALIEESNEDKPGVVIDYDEGNILGLEILDALKRMENPRSVEFGVTS